MGIEFYLQDHGRNMDYDDSKIDDDLDKLLQHIKEEQQNSLVKLF
jgi:mediator of RNA polymerase II transcription subunit 12